MTPFRAERPAHAPHEPRFMFVAFGVALFAATAVAYIPALQAGYIWDDDSYLTRNPLVQAGWDGLWHIWTTRETPQYYPVVFTTFWIEHKLWALSPAGFHIVNVALHFTNALLVWRLAQRLRLPAAWFIAAVFALHPVYVESVAWITERKNVLSGTFFLLALGRFLTWSEHERCRTFAGGAAFFVCALLSKSVTAMLAPALPPILWYHRGCITQRMAIGAAVLIVIGAAVGLHTAHMEAGKVGATGEEWNQTLLQRALIIAPSACVFYASKILWPTPLIFVYERWNLADADATWFLPAAFCAATVLIAIVGRRRWGIGPFVLLAFSAINLFPALGFVNVFPHRFAFVADHFQYLGSLGFVALCVALAATVGKLTLPANSRRRVGGGLAVLVLVLLAWRTYTQCGAYRDEETLWRTTLRANPHAWLAMINLGRIDETNAERLAPGSDRRLQLLDEAARLYDDAARYPQAQFDALTNRAGVDLKLGRIGDAIARYRAAVEIARAADERSAYAGAAGAYMSALNNLGLALRDGRKLDEAIQTMQIALEKQPDRAASWDNMANVQFSAGQFEAALTAGARAIELAPERLDFRVSQAARQMNTARFADAAREYAEILRRDPHDADAEYQRIVALYESGRDADALRACDAAMSRNRGDLRILTQLIWILATSPDDAVRNSPRAATLAEQLIRSGIGEAPARVWDVLAAAAAENGDFQTAVSLAQRAADAARHEGRPAEASEMAARADLYGTGRAYRRVTP